jgi:hypothetical protein
MDEPVPKRASPMAVFQRAVRDAFTFLETEYGFRLTVADETHVRFESDRIRLSICRGPGRNQLRLEIGRRDLEGDPPVGLPELLAVSGGRKGFRAEREILARNVLEVASVVRTLGHALLRGDPAAFRRVHGRRAREGRPA